MSLSLYARAMLLIGASLATVTALSTTLAIRERQATLTGDLSVRLDSAASQQAVAVSDALWKLNRDSTLLVLKGISQDPDFLAVQVLDESGRLFAGIGAKDVATSSTEMRRAPIVSNAQGALERIGTLELYFSRERLETAQREFLWQAIQLGLLQLAAVLLATALALRAVIKPLEAITDRMLALAGGDLARPIPFRTRPDQVGDIARAVETFGREMAARRLATSQLEDAQQNLELRIAERTRDLRESEERFRNLFHRSPLPMWVSSVDSGRFVEVNDAALGKYGYAREEFLSMTLRGLLLAGDVEQPLPVAPDAPHRAQAFESRHRHCDGKVVDVETYAHRFEFMGAEARLAVIIDVTARKLAERQFQRIFETSQDIIIVADSDGTYTQVSPSSLIALGYRPQEMVGCNGTEFIHPPDLETTREAMRRARDGLDTRGFRCRYVHRDGHLVPLVWMAVWSEPDCSHFFIGRDMTEHERTEEQLRQSQKMETFGQLAGGVAHDFNNSLAVVMMSVENILDIEAEGTEIHASAGTALHAAEQASALTKRLLAFSRRQALSPVELDVATVVDDLRKILRSSISRIIDLTVRTSSDDWRCILDRTQLETAVMNLVINARDAIQGNGLIRVEVDRRAISKESAMTSHSRVGNWVVVAVADNGQGMTEEISARIFEPFFTTKEVGKGTGLGLSQVHSLVTQSGGFITVDSTIGLGTRIALHFPAKAHLMHQRCHATK